MKKKRIFPFALSLLIAAGTIGVAGCGSGASGGDASTEATTTAQASSDSTTAATTTTSSSSGSSKSSGEVTAFLGTSIFDGSLDPVKGSMSYGYPFVCNALVKVDTNSDYVGDLAEKWEISDDALTYTYTLKDGIKFSDGSDFNAEDVVFTYNEVKNNQANNENVDLTSLDSVTAKDDHTVEFKLKEPYSPFLDTTAMLQIVPSDAYDSAAFDTKPIGTGAYKVIEYTPNQQIILEANKDHFGGAPSIDKVTIVYMDQDAAIAAAQSGQLDIVMVGSTYADKTAPGMTMERFETMDVRQISFPMIPEQKQKDAEGKEYTVGNNITSDKAVREALSIGINREEIIKNAFNGVGKPAVHFTSNLIWASTDQWTDNRTDEAIKILEDAGWVLDGDVRKKDGVACEIDVIAPGNDEDRYNLAVAFAEDAKRLGIKINAKNYSWDDAGNLMYSTPLVWGWGQYSPTVIESLFHSKNFLTGYSNVIDYNNPDADAAIDNALKANSHDKAIEYWKEAQSIADKDYPYLYLVNIEHCYFVNDNLDLSNSTQIPHPHGHGGPIICNMKDWSWK